MNRKGLLRLAMLFRAEKQHHKAVAAVKQLYDVERQELGETHKSTLRALFHLAMANGDDGRPEVQERLLRQLLDAEKGRGENDSNLASALAALARCLETQGKFDQAIGQMKESLAIREEITPGSYRSFDLKSRIGNCLAGQGQFDQAEPLLLEGYEGLVKLAEKIPSSSRKRLQQEAIQRLIDLFGETGETEKLEKWKSRLSELGVESTSNKGE